MLMLDNRLDILYKQLTCGIKAICDESHNYSRYFEGRGYKHKVDLSCYNRHSKWILLFINEIFDCENLCFIGKSYDKWADALFSSGKCLDWVNVLAKRIIFYFMANADKDIESIKQMVSRLHICRPKEKIKKIALEKQKNKYSVIDRYIQSEKLTMSSHYNYLRQIYKAQKDDLLKEFILFFALQTHLAIRISEAYSLQIKDFYLDKEEFKVKRLVKKKGFDDYLYGSLNKFCLVEELKELIKKRFSQHQLFSNKLFFDSNRFSVVCQNMVGKMTYVNPLTSVVKQYVHYTHIARCLQINLMYFLNAPMQEIMDLTGHSNSETILDFYITPEIKRLVSFNNVDRMLDRLR